MHLAARAFACDRRVQPDHGTDREVVRAECDMQTEFLRWRADRVVVPEAPVIHERRVATFQVPQEIRLLRDHDVVARHDFHRVVGRHDREVVEEPAMIRAGRQLAANGARVRVHGLHDRGIADRVDAHLPTELCARIGHFLKLRVREPSLAAITRHALVVDERPGSGAGETSVHRRFTDSTDPHAHIAIAALVRESFQSLGPRIIDVHRHARDVVLGCNLLQTLERKAWTRILDAALSDRLVAERSRRVDAGDAERQQPLQPIDVARTQIVPGVVGNVAAIQVRTFADDAVGLALPILLDHSAIWVGRVAIDLCDLQCE